MRTSLGRVTAALFATAGLLTWHAPRASATTVITVTFLGDMSTSGGLGDPCTPIGTTDPQWCPASFALTTEPTQKGGVPVPRLVVTNGATRPFTFSSVVCLGAEASVQPGKGPAHAPFCALGTAGVITGFCGSASATGSGFFYIRLLLSEVDVQRFDFTWKLTWLTTPYGYDTMYLTGTVTKADSGATGSLTGRIETAADYSPWTGSCTNGTATHLYLRGDMVFKILV